MSRKESVEDRLLKYLDKTGDCWVYTAHKSIDGYGKIRDGKRARGAHRVAYELWVGPIPKGSLIRHLCNNPACCNPKHLKHGTHQDNANDMTSTNRQAKWEKHSHVKLTEQQVKEIREKYVPRKYTTRMLAKEYGVSHTNIEDIVNRVTWI